MVLSRVGQQATPAAGNVQWHPCGRAIVWDAQNVVAQDYPNLLITTGYWDSQVQYWEPAKWIAKLRDTKTDNNTLVMDCNMEVGHGGASGRFKRFKEVALSYAFLLDLENQKK